MTENKRIRKFRGRRVDNLEWVYGAGIVIVGDDYAAVPLTKDVTSRDYQITLCKVVPETVGEFIGLRDKNQKDIFEGDIVLVTEEGEESVHEVIYGIEYDYPAFDLKPSLDAECNELQHCVVSAGVTIEIIGTKYENPELIKS